MVRSALYATMKINTRWFECALGILPINYGAASGWFAARSAGVNRASPLAPLRKGRSLARARDDAGRFYDHGALFGRRFMQLLNRSLRSWLVVRSKIHLTLNRSLWSRL